MVMADEDLDTQLMVRREATIMLLKKGGGIAAGSLNYGVIKESLPLQQQEQEQNSI